MYLYTASIKPFPARTVRCYVYNRKARPFFIYTYHNATEHAATLGYVVSCNSRTSIRSAVGTFFIFVVYVITYLPHIRNTLVVCTTRS
jgi:hypothetical protein